VDGDPDLLEKSENRLAKTPDQGDGQPVLIYLSLYLARKVL